MKHCGAQINVELILSIIGNGLFFVLTLNFNYNFLLKLCNVEENRAITIMSLPALNDVG